MSSREPWKIAQSAAEQGNINKLEELYDQYGGNIRINNIFLTACSLGNIDIAKWALNHGADINTNDGDGLVLFLTGQNVNSEFLDFLISEGITLEGNGGKEYIKHKLWEGDIETVLTMFESGKINYNDLELLESAIKYEEVYNYLVEHGVEDENNSILRSYIEQTSQDYDNEEVSFLSEILLLIKNAKNLDFEIIEFAKQSNERLYNEIIKFLTASENTKGNTENVESKGICINSENISMEPLDGSEKFVVFLLENSQQGYCYTLYELGKILDPENQVFEWDGPPAPYNAGDGNYGPIREKPVFRLPYNGIWVKWETIINAILLARNNNTEFPNVITLSKKKQSIGSSFGASQLHGQWGGQWEPITQIIGSRFVQENNATPDEREFVYY